MSSSSPTLYTLGHSTRTLEEFLDILSEHKIKLLVDVRTVPRSRRVPQFNTENLSKSLPRHHIQYLHLPALGGLRKARRDSLNTGWRNQSFRGYADYMQTPAFATALEKLMTVAQERPTTIMCAEAVPWRCHRSLIADALVVRGHPACEIASATRLQPHRLTPFAVVHGQEITYPPEEDVDA